jgi:hypothetical protein
MIKIEIKDGNNLTGYIKIDNNGKDSQSQFKYTYYPEDILEVFSGVVYHNLKEGKLILFKKILEDIENKGLRKDVWKPQFSLRWENIEIPKVILHDCNLYHPKIYFEGDFCPICNYLESLVFWGCIE